MENEGTAERDVIPELIAITNKKINEQESLPEKTDKVNTQINLRREMIRMLEDISKLNEKLKANALPPIKLCCKNKGEKGCKE